MTWTGRRFLAAVSLAGAFALGGCAYDDGYYGGVSVGTGYYAGGYYDDYWGPGYYRPGYYGGWYNDFYYPGTGYFVYDRGGRRHRWNEGQRRYWEGRREAQRAEAGRSWRGVPRQSQGEPGGWRGRSREGSANAAPVNPPIARSQPGTNDNRMRSWTPRTQSDTRGRSDGRDRSRGDNRWGLRR